MKKEIVNVPGSTNPYLSPAVKAGNYVFASGQVPSPDAQGIEVQTKQVLEKIKVVLETAGASLSDVVKTTVFLVDANDFAKMNEVYGSFFTEDRPARSTIVVAALAKPEYKVEIECIALLS